jgi:hypothetical protein
MPGPGLLAAAAPIGKAASSAGAAGAAAGTTAATTAATTGMTAGQSALMSGGISAGAGLATGSQALLAPDTPQPKDQKVGVPMAGPGGVGPTRASNINLQRPDIQSAQPRNSLAMSLLNRR